MVDAPKTTKAPRDRSPSFPFIPLKTAVERLAAFESFFGRHPTPTSKAGLAWKMKEKSSQADQTLAALRSFGLIRYTGSGTDRQASLTDDGRNYLRTQQDSVKRQILKQGALRPRIIRKFWTTWGPDRPPDPVALDQLYVEGFSDGGAANFLRVYDETISYAGLADSDKIPDENDDDQENENMQPASDLAGKSRNPTPPRPSDGLDQAVFPLWSGRNVTITFPPDMDASELSMLDGYLDVFLKRAHAEQEKREIEATARAAGAPDEEEGDA